MKKIVLSICCSMLIMASCTSSQKKTEETKDTVSATTVTLPADEQAIRDVVIRFTEAYLQQENSKANTFIHPDLGLYIIYRPGAADTYERIDSIDFNRPTPEYFPYSTFENDYTLTFGPLPVFDCGAEKWDKLGFFCDTTSQANQLTRIASFKLAFNEIDEAEETKIKQLEKDTYRVILTKNENLIFHVKKTAGKWYVLVLDRAYAWCDA